MLQTYRCSPYLRVMSRSIRLRFQNKPRTPMQHLQRNAGTISKSNAPSDPPLEAVQKGTIGFGFSAGGLLFPYYVGIMLSLRDELNVLKPETPVAGASAGSLVAATAKSGISEGDLMQATLQLARDCRDNGTRFRLKSVLKKTLEDVLPEDIHERCSGTAHIAVTQVWPRIEPQLISEFQSREDLIETLLVSCHIPWYFDGSWITGHRDRLALDGGFTNFLPVPPNCPGVVRVACFPSSQLRAYRNIGISPDNFEEWPYDMRQMLGWAFQPASEDFLVYLVDKGKQDARSWAKSHGVINVGDI
ncbi:hypothetical protein CEUSTIGMA_g92.t1 [Chlamydomonas eustigma]|uniref:Patatin n=1 Tax=Chlamydomonas eustigma TaxID=1157962 RepID=A0A250WPL3_9CHLO|nr:hypothetical protein CEUSTIGMA_g92.t1 [Chlamydomonas eustigma]|eukprot:GAX72636.1 hypothetical protein CEUSTIGMA_g92.t1 [Chlamydomonas eustigma]